MGKLKERMIRLIQQNARNNLTVLTSQYIQAKSEEREAVHDGIQFERWMADTCQEILDGTL